MKGAGGVGSDGRGTVIMVGPSLGSMSFSGALVASSVSVIVVDDGLANDVEDVSCY